MTPTPGDEFARLHAALGWRRLNPWWAKAEIVLGLAAAGGGLFLGARLAPAPDPDATMLMAALALFVLGGYLALAGHRSHLYQSSNQLTAYLAADARSRAQGPNP